MKKLLQKHFLSGELLGNFYNQGREIAKFLPKHPDGFEANFPMSWRPHPFKGYIFVSDFNSGLWALKLNRGDNQNVQ